MEKGVKGGSEVWSQPLFQKRNAFNGKNTITLKIYKTQCSAQVFIVSRKVVNTSSCFKAFILGGQGEDFSPVSLVNFWKKTWDLWVI